MDIINAKLKKASQAVKMDPHVRDGFRRTLAVMVDSPVATPAVFRMRRAFAWATAGVLVLVSGASVTLASTRSIPGDPLYSAKVAVIEPVERALAFSDEAKGQVAVAHLERRFREAAELSAAGTYDDHDEELAALATRDREILEADEHVEARAKFESIAAAYAPVLRSKQAQGKAFAMAVRLRDVASDDVPDDVAAATVREQIARVKRTTESEVSRRYASRLREADRLATAASAALDEGSFSSALELSGTAAQIAAEVELFAAFSTDTEATTTTSTASSTATTTASTTTSTAPINLDETEDTEANTSTTAPSTRRSGPNAPSILRYFFPGN